MLNMFFLSNILYLIGIYYIYKVYIIYILNYLRSVFHGFILFAMEPIIKIAF